MTSDATVDHDGRNHITSSLMRESLVDRSVLDRTGSVHELAILPDVLLVSIGGQSIFDRGRDAVLPVVEQLAAARAAHRRMVVAVGGGTRVRHTIAIALDLGLPTGGVAQLVGAMEEANAVFLNALLAKHGSIVMQREHFWEPPPEGGSQLPAHGSDFGTFVHADVLGMRRILFVKDEDGLYDRDPKRHKHARLIRRIGLAELLHDLPDELIVDRQLFESWRNARHVREVQIVNGLRPGELARALAGEDVGTVITKEAV